jgi:Methyltransferase domain
MMGVVVRRVLRSLGDSSDSTMTNHDPSVPTAAPDKIKAWRQQLHRSNFVNAARQWEDLRSLGDAASVLIVGPGQGLDTLIFRWRGYKVTTFDNTPILEPDVVGSVHDLSMFGDLQFDVVIASHVIEHVPVPYLDATISELSRVARHAIIYLPVRGRHLQLRLQPGFRDLDLSFVLDLFNFFRKPDGVTPLQNNRGHFWELGMRGFRLGDVVRRLETHFEVVRHYRNADWIQSHNFVLRSRWTARG